MPTIALCKNQECSKKDSCLRFQTKDIEDKVLEFKNICNESNNYKRYIQIEKEVIKKDKNN